MQVREDFTHGGVTENWKARVQRMWHLNWALKEERSERWAGETTEVKIKSTIFKIYWQWWQWASSQVEGLAQMCLDYVGFHSVWNKQTRVNYHTRMESTRGNKWGKINQSHFNSWLLTLSKTYIALLTGECFRLAVIYYWHLTKIVGNQDLVQIRKLIKSAFYKLQAHYLQSKTDLDFGALPSSEHDLNSITTCQGWSHC